MIDSRRMTELEDFASLLRDDRRSSTRDLQWNLPRAACQRHQPALMMTDDERGGRHLLQKQVRGGGAARDTSWSRETAKQSASEAWRNLRITAPEGACFVLEGACDQEIAQRWLKDAGWITPNQGGYKAMRRWLSESRDQLIEHTPSVYSGPHWCAKTASSMKATGGEPIPGSVDLEGWLIIAARAFGRRVTSNHPNRF
ncbi:MAG: hypothetical protein CM15mP89_5310 [Gammaproteobacteria bacterium]|nr:MAG: hypothetical protein CM15mP89_5310 [Gammaproteobacteria bacterium]